MLFRESAAVYKILVYTLYMALVCCASCLTKPGNSWTSEAIMTNITEKKKFCMTLSDHILGSFILV